MVVEIFVVVDRMLVFLRVLVMVKVVVVMVVVIVMVMVALHNFFFYSSTLKLQCEHSYYLHCFNSLSLEKR